MKTILKLWAACCRAKTILRHNNFTAIYDKGYHTGSRFDCANSLGIDVLVAIPGVSAHAPDLALM
jgi:hypothetical protein